MSHLDEALTRYQAALDYLRLLSGCNLQAAALQVLEAHNAVRQAVIAAPSLSSAVQARLTALDQQFQTRLATILHDGKSSYWRQTSDGLADPEGWPLASWWDVLTWALLFIALMGIVHTWIGFLSVDAPFFQFLTSVLTLLPLSTLTKAGRQWVHHGFSRLGIAPQGYAKWQAGLACAIFLLTGVAIFWLPRHAAHYYNASGYRLRQAGKLIKAREHYQRAIKLQPDAFAPHYNLALIYEDTLEPDDQALREYKLALRADPTFYAAYNDLARLYILRHDYYSALLALNTALPRTTSLKADEQRVVQYTVYKNLAWAYLCLEDYDAAKANINEALQLRPDGVAVQCLKAQMLEKQGHQEEARQVWHRCRNVPGEPVEDDWLGRALARTREKNVQE